MKQVGDANLQIFKIPYFDKKAQFVIKLLIDLLYW